MKQKGMIFRELFFLLSLACSLCCICVNFLLLFANFSSLYSFFFLCDLCNDDALNSTLGVTCMKCQSKVNQSSILSFWANIVSQLKCANLVHNVSQTLHYSKTT